jgi:hypothetical protein
LSFFNRLCNEWHFTLAIDQTTEHGLAKGKSGAPIKKAWRFLNAMLFQFNLNRMIA